MAGKPNHIDTRDNRGENLAKSGGTPNLVAGGVGFQLPPRTRRLLWVVDSGAPRRTRKTQETTEITLHSDLLGDVVWDDNLPAEPSTVYTEEPVTVPADADLVTMPGGGSLVNQWEGDRTERGYMSLTPEQRWVYLNWLQDPMQAIHENYLQLYYLGLERHLLLGDFDEAYAEVSELRKNHHDEFFLDFSVSSLLASCAIRDRPECARELLSHTSYSDFCSGIRTVVASRLGMGLSVDDIIELSRSRRNWQDRPNMLYLNAYPDLFRETLRKVLLAHYGQESMPLPNPTDLLDCLSEYNAILYQNWSFSDDVTVMRLPDIAEHRATRDTTNALMAETHRAVKDVLAEERKAWRRNGNVTTLATSPSAQNQVSCPACGFPLGRGPAASMTCPHCHAALHLRKEPSTGRYVLLTAQQSLDLDARHRVLKAEKIIEGIAHDLGLSPKAVVRLQETASRERARAMTPADVLLPLLERQLKPAASKRNWGSLCSNYADSSTILTQVGRTSDAFNCGAASEIIDDLMNRYNWPESEMNLVQLLSSARLRPPSRELLGTEWLQDLAQDMGTPLSIVLPERLPFIIKCILECCLPLSSSVSLPPTDTSELTKR